MPADLQHELESLRSEVRKLTDALELAKGELALALDEIKRKERVIAGLQQRLFGASSEKLDPNQLHLLFAPIMTAYGLAFISILWSRLEFVASTPILRNVHHIVIVGICALPLILSLPQKVRVGMDRRDRGGVARRPLDAQRPAAGVGRDQHAARF